MGGSFSSHTLAKKVNKAALPGIWVASWLFTPEDRNEYWLVLINYLALLMLPLVYTSPHLQPHPPPQKKEKENSNNKNTFQLLFIL